MPSPTAATALELRRTRRGPSRPTRTSPVKRPAAIANEKAANPTAATEGLEPSVSCRYTALQSAIAPSAMSPSKARIPSVKSVPDGRATAGPAWSPSARGRASPGSATTAADSATKADTRTCATSPMPTAIAPPASSAPATPPRLNSAWNDDMIGRPTRCSTSAAWAFIDTSRRPLQAPRSARESESRATLGLATGRGSARQSATPAAAVITRLPSRPTSQPATGSATTEPAAMDRRTSPS